MKLLHEYQIDLEEFEKIDKYYDSPLNKKEKLQIYRIILLKILQNSNKNEWSYHFFINIKIRISINFLQIKIKVSVTFLIYCKIIVKIINRKHLVLFSKFLTVGCS